MTKTTLQKKAEELRALSLSLMEQVRQSRQVAQGQTNTLRALENQIRLQYKEEQERIQREREAAALASFVAPDSADGQDKWVVPQAAAAVSTDTGEEPVEEPMVEEAAPTPEPVASPPQAEEPQPPKAAPAPAQPAPRPAQRPNQRPLVGERAPRPAAAGERGPRPAAAGDRGRPGERSSESRPPRPAGPGGAGAGRPVGQRSLGRIVSKELPPVQEKEKASNYNPRKKDFEREKAAKLDNRQRSKKQLLRQQAPSIEEREFVGRRRKPRQVQPAIERKVIESAVITTEMVPIKVLAEKIGVPGAQIVKKLFLLGIVATINQEIDFDTAALVASEFNVTLEQQLEKSYEDVMMDTYEEAAAGDLVPRPPVVTVMGHVDHGKTSLLDVIRKSRVTETEAGGITQHIGAYVVDVGGQSITFLDTPGHEAFTSMRARGAKVTDIAVLVVAADDGVMPQTVEAINHAKAANVPIIVAINKMDLPTANPDRVRQELSEHGVIPEAWGGDTIMVEVSAATKMGIDNLLESILLLAEMEDLRADPSAKATGTVIEARLDKGRGPVATVLVNNGTLRVGDTIVAGMVSGRVRAMLDDTGRRVDEATPSMPVEVIGFSEVPEAGDTLHCVDDEKLARRVAAERQDKMKIDRMKTAARVSLDDLYDRISEGEMKTLNIIIKGDVQGSVEAVKQALEKLSTPEVKIDTIHSGVGAITEGDIMLASTANAIVIGFNVRPDANGRAAADREKVDVRMYRIIYNAVEDMEKALKGMLAPEFKETVLGHAQVRNVFQITGVGAVAGCYVTDGVIRRNAKVRVLRDSVVIHEGTLSSLKRFKDDVREVATGYECGISIQGYNDIKENDVIEAFIMEQVER